MSSEKWTKEQLDAITLRDNNILVAAAAGSGKTTVLVERIIRRITDIEPCDIDSLLVVTFTNAAASEMKERIGDAIGKKIEEQPQNHFLQRQLLLLNKANITTIHSFCLNIIRNNIHLLDIDPGFRVGDTTEVNIIKKESIEETLEHFYEIGDENFLRLVESYAPGKVDSKLEDIIDRVYRFSVASPFPIKWLNENAEMLNVNEDFDFSLSKWGGVLIDNIKRDFKYYLEEGERILNLIKLEDFPPKYIEVFNSIIGICSDVIVLCEDNTLTKKFSNINGALQGVKLPALSGKVTSEELKSVASEFKKDFTALIKKQIGLLFKSEEEIIYEMKFSYPCMKTLAIVVEKFMEVFSEKKKERGVIDFNDIEHFALKILTSFEDGEVIPSKEALEYREKFTEILVDEYQDSNYVQEYILDTISKKDIGNRFMVGDVKQSIYRFRQAKPEIFLNKYRDFEYKDGGERILLYKNFRSRDEILNGVNFIFEKIMSESVGELSYTESERLNTGADFQDHLIDGFEAGGKIELNIIEDVKDEENEEDVDKVSLEARFVAGRIKSLIDGDSPFNILSKNPDTGESEYRKARYKDIVILLRSTKNISDVFETELTLAGIPCFSDSGGGYFDTIEVKTIISLLKVIDNPLQDVYLLSMLKSPIFSFTPEDMIDLRIANCDSFYDALKALYSEENEIGIKCKKVLGKIKEWQLKGKNTPIDKFLWFLYGDTGYYSYLGVLPNGFQRQANLKVLFERAREFMSTSFKGLFSFISFIDKLKISSGDMSGAKVLSENEDVVRIMSIHKSKGLEFPICICSGFGRKFNVQDFRESILLHSELGFGPDIVDLEKRIKYKSTIKEAIKTKLQIEAKSEEMRILYVAFTRAKEKLIITGTTKKIGDKLFSWGSLGREKALSEAKTLSAPTYFDLINPVILSNENEDFVFKTNVIYKGDILANSEEIIEIGENAVETLKNLSPEYETDKINEIDRRLNFKYSREYLAKIPSKLSVTEAKRIINIRDNDLDLLNRSFVLKTPNFLKEEKRITASEKGTLMHFMMQKVDLDKDINLEYLKEKVKSLINGEFITKEEGNVINLDGIYKFFKSELGKRVLGSVKVLREVPFHIEVPVDYVYKEYSESDEKIAIQGIIDCFFEEDGEIVLIDYKTDYVNKDNIEEVYEKYKVQIDIYTLAIEKLTGKKVKDKYIYLLTKGMELKY